MQELPRYEAPVFRHRQAEIRPQRRAFVPGVETAFPVRGTAKQVADELEHWFVGKAADGFNLLPAYLPGSLDDFVNEVIPELQRRGLYRRNPLNFAISQFNRS